MLNSEIMSNDSSDGDVSLSSGNVENVEPNETGSADCRPCDPLKVLKFVECLSATTNSIEMQILVNKYVSIKKFAPFNVLSVEEFRIMFCKDESLMCNCAYTNSML